MKKDYLDQEEKELAKAIENDEFVPVSAAELKKVADAIAAKKNELKGYHNL